MNLRVPQRYIKLIAIAVFTFFLHPYDNQGVKVVTK